MFFIVSTGRSGTATIANILSRVEGCICLHEPSPELIYESSAYRYGEISTDELLRCLRETRQPKINGHVYCESNQTLSLIIPVLVEVFPEARFIWLIRNGLDVVASAYQKQWYSGHSENNERYEDCPPIEKAWIDGRIQGDLCGDLSPSEWEKLDRFGRCCWYWGYINKIIEEDLNRYVLNRFFFIRLEEINTEMAKLLDWMDLKTDKLPPIERHNIAKRIPFYWTEWSTQQFEAFEKLCGDMMSRYYPSWQSYANKDSALFFGPAFEGLKNKVEQCSEQLKFQQEKHQQLLEEQKSYATKMEEKDRQIQQIMEINRGLKAHIQHIQKSRSWKLTKPLREVANILRKLRV